MKTDGKEYNDYAARHMPRSKSKRNLLRAFVSGGAVCCIGQGIMNLYLALGLAEDAAATAETITLVLIGVLLTGIGVYDKLAKFSGAGTLVPITGFANSVASPALEFKTEGLILGTSAKMFTIAGPVIVWGTAASVVYGIIYYILL